MIWLKLERVACLQFACLQFACLQYLVPDDMKSDGLGCP